MSASNGQRVRGAGRFADDVNGDGDGDFILRGPAGLYVASSTFQSARLVSTFLSDAAGFVEQSYHTSFQLADVNGDARADLVMRGHAGVRVQIANASGEFPFAATLANTFFSNSAGSGASIYRDSVRTGDVSGVGRVSFVQRGGAGVWVQP